MNNKTASIITMHCPLNYGAVLQTYAFQTYLEKNGIKTQIIDYNPEYIVYDQSLMYVGNEQLKKYWITRWLYRIIKFPVKSKRKRLFKRFRNNELHLTSRYETFDELERASISSDYFFCGSDQIWNTKTGAHLDPSYFLGFVKDKNKCSSYAASGNLPLIDEVKEKTFPMINRLSNVSIREDSTINTIQPYIDKTIVHVCDPVFLLDLVDWKKLYQKKSTFKKREKYILVYPMGLGVENVLNKAVELSAQLKLPIYCLTDSQKRDKRISKYINTDPYTFLSLIDNADYVVTNSFHGTSFSIIFEKIFWTCVAVGTNHRLESLLHRCGLQNRVLSEQSNFILEDLPDFKNVKCLLKGYIDSSKLYIKNIIK